MNPELDRLHPYPFQKLAGLFAGTQPGDRSPIAFSIGEPKHPTPGFIRESMLEHLHTLATYPTTQGSTELRTSIASWLARRFDLPASVIDPAHHVLPVNGTREALFAFAQAVIDRSRPALVFMPNPFYQIYEGAALLAGAQPYFMPCVEENGFLPDIDRVSEEDWQRCQLLYLCTPGNPTGAVMPENDLIRLLELAERYDFVLASDECYSEIYPNEAEPPPGLLGACIRAGNTEFKRCVVFHSLSKRSNAPGLRSGFVAGDAEILRRFLQYRTYQGGAMPPPAQAASAKAWQDESHVRENRALYREKFDRVLEILSPIMDVTRPAGGFYLWPRTPIGDTEFARMLYARENVVVLPGRYLSRPQPQGDPGENRVRIALVAPLDECIEGAQRIRHLIESL